MRIPNDNYSNACNLRPLFRTVLLLGVITAITVNCDKHSDTDAPNGQRGINRPTSDATVPLSAPRPTSGTPLTRDSRPPLPAASPPSDPNAFWSEKLRSVKGHAQLEIVEAVLEEHLALHGLHPTLELVHALPFGARRSRGLSIIADYAAEHDLGTSWLESLEFDEDRQIAAKRFLFGRHWDSVDHLARLTTNITDPSLRPLFESRLVDTISVQFPSLSDAMEHLVQKHPTLTHIADSLYYSYGSSHPQATLMYLAEQQSLESVSANSFNRILSTLIRQESPATLAQVISELSHTRVISGILEELVSRKRWEDIDTLFANLDGPTQQAASSALQSLLPHE